MDLGLFSIGIGAAARPETIALIAGTAERCGFHSLWAPEHVVLFEQYASRYPYNDEGRIPLAARADLLDPLIALTYAAACTTRLRLGTGVCLLPERNPVVTAKEVASLDVVSNGRFDFGIGIGWLAEEFAALGVPWQRRSARTREYVAALRTLWTEAEPEFNGEFVRFAKLTMFPKPVQKPHPPILIGGNTAAALRRVAEFGDGWFGFGLTPDDARASIAEIRRLARAAGRDPARLRFIAASRAKLDLDAVKRFREAGVDELIVHGVPADPQAIVPRLEQLAQTLVAPASGL